MLNKRIITPSFHSLFPADTAQTNRIERSSRKKTYPKAHHNMTWSNGPPPHWARAIYAMPSPCRPAKIKTNGLPSTVSKHKLNVYVYCFFYEKLKFSLCSVAVDFFNQINMLYGTITEFCTEEKCAIMSAGPKYEYHWADGQTVKKPIKCSAPKYIDYLMTWVQDQLDDETLFPSKIGVPFPKNFLTIAKTILKRLFRVYAHIYHQHFNEVVHLGEEAHLNTSFKHFIFFVQEFNLIDQRELAPLQELINKLTKAKDVNSQI